MKAYDDITTKVDVLRVGELRILFYKHSAKHFQGVINAIEFDNLQLSLKFLPSLQLIVNFILHQE